MPVSQTQEGRRGGRLLIVAFWIGVGLAPLAALLVLVSSGATAMRVAAVLAILAVVLIGLSVMLRPDAASVRIELEETLLDEVDMVREDVRQDIATAARATHRSFSEKLQTLYEHVESLRRQVDAPRPGRPERGEPPIVPARPVASAPPAASGQVPGAVLTGGVVRHTETVRETTRHTVVDQHGDGDRGTVYGGTVYGAGGGGGVGGGRRDWPDEGDPDPEWRSEARRRDRDAEPRPAAGHGVRGPAGSARPRPGGLWRDDADSQGDDGRDYLDADHREPDHRDTSYREPDYRDAGHRAPDYGESDRRELDHHRRGHRDAGYRDGDIRRSRVGEPDDPGDDPRWSDMRAGDRWTSLRSDERGREVRMGERRAAVHRDGSGTELRIEDRWAAVREEDSRRGRDEPRGRRRDREQPWADDEAAGYREPGRWTEESWQPRHPQARPDRALPAAPSESGWQDRWPDDERPQERWPDDERSREPRRRRAADPDDRWDRDDGPRAAVPRPRRFDFEMSDDRWR